MGVEVERLEAAARALAEASPGELADELSADTFQAVMTQLVKCYLVRRESGEEFPPTTAEITATEASIAASALMKAADLEFFEVTLWNSWGRV